VPKLLWITGILVICAGLDLLWQSRHEIKFWLMAYLAVFRAMLRQQDSPLRDLQMKEAAAKRRGAVHFLLGVSFAFFLGPILIALGSL
jgi:hypothetical protein